MAAPAPPRAEIGVRGGDGTLLWIGYIAPTVAVELTACQTKLMGGPGDYCRAGTAVNGVGAGVVVISGGSTTIDPTLPLQPCSRQTSPGMRAGWRTTGKNLELVS